MNLSSIPYRGTIEELREVDQEIAKNQRDRAALDAEHRVLVEHRMQIMRLMD